jgi:hypothetical protein
VTKKTSNVPVFLIYAGIIHAIGLALLMPMLITLPGPASVIAPQSAAIDVEIIPGSPIQAKIDGDGEQTSALPSAPPSAEQDEAVAPDPAGEAVANVSPAAEPEGEAAAKPEPDAPAEADSPAEAVKQETKTKATAPAKAAPRAAKKPAVKRSRTAKTSVKRPSKTETKIAPFNGALTGLFSPGAPANTRRR